MVDRLLQLCIEFSVVAHNFGCGTYPKHCSRTIMLASESDGTTLQMEEQRAGKHTGLPEFIFSHFQKRIGIPAAVVEVPATQHTARIAVADAALSLPNAPDNVPCGSDTYILDLGARAVCSAFMFQQQSSVIRSLPLPTVKFGH